MVFLHLWDAASAMKFALNLVTVATISGRFVHVSMMNACRWTILFEKYLLFVQFLITALHCHFNCNQVFLHYVRIKFKSKKEMAIRFILSFFKYS